MNKKLDIEQIKRVSIEQFRRGEKNPLVVVLDNVRSMHNVGSVFRTSDAFCIEKIILCGITATPPNAEIHKAALGAEFSVEWQYLAKTEDAISLLKKENYCVVAIEQTENSVSLPDFEFIKQKKYAIVLGNEVNGVGQEVIDLCHWSIEIPQFGTKHSLNVSVAAGITIWNFFAKTKF